MQLHHINCGWYHHQVHAQSIVHSTIQVCNVPKLHPYSSVQALHLIIKGLQSCCYHVCKSKATYAQAAEATICKQLQAVICSTHKRSLSHLCYVDQKANTNTNSLHGAVVYSANYWAFCQELLSQALGFSSTGAEVTATSSPQNQSTSVHVCVSPVTSAVCLLQKT